MEDRLQKIIGAQVMQIVALQLEVEKLKEELGKLKPEQPSAPPPA